MIIKIKAFPRFFLLLQSLFALFALYDNTLSTFIKIILALVVLLLFVKQIWKNQLFVIQYLPLSKAWFLHAGKSDEANLITRFTSSYCLVLQWQLNQAPFSKHSAVLFRWQYTRKEWHDYRRLITQ